MDIQASETKIVPSNDNNSSSSSSNNNNATNNIITTSEETKGLNLLAKWKGESYEIQVTAETTLKDLKEILYTLTNVLPKRQKIVGLTKSGEIASDDRIKMGDIGIGYNPNVSAHGMKVVQKFMLIGNPEKEMFVDLPEEEIGDDLVNDLDYDYQQIDDGVELNSQVANHPEHLKKLKKCSEKLSLSFISSPRPGKKLLVLDLVSTTLSWSSIAMLVFC